MILAVAFFISRRIFRNTPQVRRSLLMVVNSLSKRAHSKARLMPEARHLSLIGLIPDMKYELVGPALKVGHNRLASSFL